MGPGNRAGKPRGRRRLLTIEQKKEMISFYEAGIRIVDLAAMFNVASSSVATILKKKEEIKAASVAAGVKTLAARSQRSPAIEEMEKRLVVWINQRRMAGDTLTQNVICSKARGIYGELKRSEAGHSREEGRDGFKGSKGWFENFKRRSGIHRREDEADTDGPERFVRQFQRWIMMRTYEPDRQVERTLVAKETARVKAECQLEEGEGERGGPEVVPVSDTEKILYYWRQFESLAAAWHPDRAEMTQLFALVEDKCLKYFKTVLNQRRDQSSQMGLLTPPPERRLSTSADAETSRVHSVKQGGNV